MAAVAIRFSPRRAVETVFFSFCPEPEVCEIGKLRLPLPPPPPTTTRFPSIYTYNIIISSAVYIDIYIYMYDDVYIILMTCATACIRGPPATEASAFYPRDPGPGGVTTFTKTIRGETDEEEPWNFHGPRTKTESSAWRLLRGFWVPGGGRSGKCIILLRLSAEGKPHFQATVGKKK